MRSKAVWVLLSIALLPPAFAQEGLRQRALRPHEYGNVVMNNYSEKNNIAPVVFNHWLHRAEYSCRLCHVDLGFAMAAGKTGVMEDDNNRGLYCGACHNGKEAFGPREKDQAVKNCDRCHSYGKNVKFQKEFYDFAKEYPKSRFGNKIDWLAAEEKGMVKLKDQLEGFSTGGESLKQTKNIEIKSKEFGISDIIFSHEKHTVWNGCELCHPEIFGVKKGSTVYSMQDIFNGKYCGACHGKVAFPNTDCRLCHVKEVY
jgi:c(7)-type cytochrome triheme protein